MQIYILARIHLSGRRARSRPVTEHQGYFLCPHLTTGKWGTGRLQPVELIDGGDIVQWTFL